MSLLRKYIREIISEIYGGPGVEQSIGMGKNIHTLDPQPITWENFPGLEYDISADPSGEFWASVSDLDNPENSTPTRKFADEDTAMFWIRNQYDILHRNKLNSQ